MHIKLLELLRSLPENELLQLDKFVATPFFNDSERVKNLYIFIRQFAPTFDTPKLTDESAFQYVFPERNFDAALQHKLQSQLFKLSEAFLAHRQLMRRPFERDLYVLQFYQEALLSRHVESTLQRLDKQLMHKSVPQIQEIRQRLDLEAARAEWLAKTDKRTGDINLEKLNQTLDDWFLINKLAYLNSMLGRQKIVKVRYELTWLSEILQRLENIDYQRIPAIEIYREILFLQLHPGEPVHYHRLKALLEEYTPNFLPEELRQFYIYLENAAKHIFPITSYFQELFTLYQYQSDTGILYENGSLSHAVFQNVVNAALALQAFDWAAQFIQANQQRIIPAAYRADCYVQNLAALHFFQGDFDEAQHLLLQSNPIDIYYKLSQKMLLAKIYFEKRELEVLENFLATFTKFIFDQQTKIAPEKVASYRLFVNFFKKLLRILSISPDSITTFEYQQPQMDASIVQQLLRLQKQVEKAPVFYSKSWLLHCIGAQYSSLDDKV
ncbi:MAG TPA: hypothetical protein PKD70_10780 [Saprospiraceae bacterium]|nr:hypothetical protein [Saprospiraceae bacterium]HMP14356.1 hypothetical protein [Saprospiraceae bacterium]